MATERTNSVSFSISENAKRQIEMMRTDWNSKFPDAAVVLWIAWGKYSNLDGQSRSGVVISFYTESEMSDISHSVIEVSGLKVFLFLTDTDMQRFQNKIIDFSPQKWFYLIDSAAI